MTLSDEEKHALWNILSAGTECFTELVRLAGLDPARAFRGARLRGLNLRGENLAGYDFSYADLTGTDFSGADTSQTIGLDSAILDAVIGLTEIPAFAQDAAEEMILAGRLPPPQWRPLITQLGFGRWGVRKDGQLFRRADEDFEKEIDLRLLAQLPNLGILALSGMAVRELAPLANLTSLRVLYLQGTKVTDVTPLASLSNLQTLFLGATFVSDLAPLVNLVNLRDLDLDNTLATNLAPLAGLASLQFLYLDGTPVTDLAPLANLANLQHLNLDGTQVTVQAIKRLQQACPKLYIIHPDHHRSASRRME